MLQPRKQKYRKQFRGRIKGVATRGQTLTLGEYGLKSLGGVWLTASQIEAARRAIAHTTKRGGKIWVRIFPDKPVTKKSAGMRMGGGKGEVSHFVAVIKPGKILFEVAGVEEGLALTALRGASAKLPVETKIIARRGKS